MLHTNIAMHHLFLQPDLVALLEFELVFVTDVAGKYIDHKYAHNAYNRTRRSR